MHPPDDRTAQPPAAPDLTVLPPALLDVVVETTRSVLQQQAPGEGSAAARAVLRFDRRALASAAARRQVVTLLDREPEVARAVAEAIGQRATAHEWGLALESEGAGGDPTAVVVRCAEAGALPELVAAVWATPAPAASFVFGLCAAAWADAERLQARAAAVAEVERALATERDARHRLVGEVEELRRNLDRAAEELRDERSHRRGRDDELGAQVLAAQAETQRVSDELAAARDRIRQLDEQRAHDARKQAELDQQVRDARTSLRELREGDAAVVAQRDELHALAEAAKRLAESLLRLDRDVQSAPAARAEAGDGRRVEREERPTPKAPTRRTPMNVPGGRVADTPDGAAAMFAATPDFVYVVDGYNVANAAWHSATPQEQRDRLLVHLEAVHQRYGCDVVVCFDGAVGTTMRTASKRRGVRVVFSTGGEEADDVVLEHVAGLSKRFPVVVATSDGWLRDELRRHGVTLIGATTAHGLHQAASRR